MSQEHDDKVIHLGDGAYASIDGYGDVCISANHHDPAFASDAVYIDKEGAAKLLDFLKKGVDL